MEKTLFSYEKNVDFVFTQCYNISDIDMIQLAETEQSESDFKMRISASAKHQTN